MVIIATEQLELPQPPLAVAIISLLGVTLLILIVLGLFSIKFKGLRIPFVVVTVVTGVCFVCGLMVSMGFAQALAFLGLVVSGAIIVIVKIVLR